MPNASERAGEVGTGKCMSGDLGELSGFSAAEVEAGVKEVGVDGRGESGHAACKFLLFKKVDFEGAGEGDS